MTDVEKVQGTLVGVDGELLQRPTLVLSADEALLVRSYFKFMLGTLRLEPEFLCGTCFDGTRESAATYEVDDQQIVIVCNCSLRFHKGETPAEKYIVPAMFPTPADDVVGVQEVPLTLEVAQLFRAYKQKFLEKFNLKETLRCNLCWDFSQPDGCKVRVTDNLVEIECRCRHMTYVGSSY